MGDTSIGWTNKTWNPVRGCSRVSEGCRNCYAERQAARFRDVGQPFHTFVRTQSNGEPQWTGKVELVENHIADPLHWKAPKRIFVNSMSDLFHEALGFEKIDKIFAVMACAPQHTFQILTKRATRMMEYLTLTQRCAIPGGHSFAEKLPLPNVWLGVSVEDQKAADERIPMLLQTPAALRFVSYEPALGPVNFLSPDWTIIQGNIWWIIVGGESGPHARPFDVQWARDTVAQCKAAGVSCFVKQLGARPGTLVKTGDGCDGLGTYRFDDIRLKDRKGEDWDEWPADIPRVREFPEAA